MRIPAWLRRKSYEMTDRDWEMLAVRAEEVSAEMAVEREEAQEDDSDNIVAFAC